MKKMLQKAKELWISEEGATATEYAVMLALIIAVSIATITFLGNQVEDTFNVVGSDIDAATP